MPHLTQNQIDGILSNLSMVLAAPDGINTVAKAVLQGDFTIADLQNTGQLSPVMLSNLNVAMDSMRGELAEENAWQEALQQNTTYAFENYLSQYPNGNHASTARTMIAGLRAQEQSSQKQMQLEALLRNINAIEPQKYGITFDEIVSYRGVERGERIHLPEEIREIYSDDGVDLKLGKTPDSIPSGRTEIYFWGAPGSGKTCTLAAILSTAKKRGFFNPQIGTGVMYMTQLSSLFSDRLATLPKPTVTEETQGLSFNLRDEQKSEHPVTLIEISGEIFNCFTNVIMGLDIQEDYRHAYESLLQFLSTNENPKYHFFVVDVNNKKRDAYGFSQMDYLTYAAKYFEEHKIFNESTAGVNILVTKSDLLGSNLEERKSEATRILKEDYINFVNALKSIAYQHNLIRSLNDTIPVIPFTLGEVYLQTKCIFDSTMSNEIIKILQQNVAKEYISRSKTNWLNW